MSDPTQLASEEKSYEVTILITQKFVIEVQAADQESAESRAIELSDQEPCVDSYVDEVKTRVMK